MKKLEQTIIYLLLIVGFLFSQTIPADNIYLGQTPLYDTPQKFKLSVNAGSLVVARIAFSITYYGAVDLCNLNMNKSETIELSK